MTEQEIKKQIEKIFSLDNIKEINSKIKELIMNNKPLDEIIKSYYEYQKQLLFRTKSYEELENLYPSIMESRREGENLVNDLFKYLTEEEVFDKVKNNNLFPFKLNYDKEVFSKLSNAHKKEMINTVLSARNIIGLIEESSNKEVYDAAKNKLEPIQFVALLNAETRINIYTPEEVLNIIKEIPENDLQKLLDYKFIINKSPEIASYISKRCNLDAYKLDLYNINDISNIEIIKNMSVEQLINSAGRFYECSDELFNYFFNNYDVDFLIKYYWGNSERNKKVLDKVTQIDKLEKDYIELLSMVKDSKYVFSKLESYNFSPKYLYNCIDRLINLSPEINDYCTKKLGVGEILRYIGDFSNYVQDKRLEYLESIKIGTDPEELMHAFYSGGFRLEEIEAKFGFLKKHNMGEENLIKILNGWHCSEILVKHFIETYGIDFVFHNFQYWRHSAEISKIILDNIKIIGEETNNFIGLLMFQDLETITSKLKEYKISEESLLSFVNKTNKLPETFLIALSKYNPSLCLNDLFVAKLNNNQIKIILDNVEEVSDKYVELLLKTMDNEYIVKIIKKNNIEFNRLYRKISPYYFQNMGLHEYAKLSDLFLKNDTYSKEELTEILSNINNIEGIEEEYLKILTTRMSELDGDFILENIKRFDIGYDHIRVFYNDLLDINANLNNYLEDKYGKFYKLEKLTDETQLISLFDSIESFKGSEKLLVEKLKYINDINFIKNKIIKCNIEKTILLKLNFNPILDKDVEILNAFIELYGKEFVLKYYEGNNNEVLKSLLDQFKQISNPEIQNEYLRKLCLLKDNKFIIEKLGTLNFNKDVFSPYLTDILEKDFRRDIWYIDVYGIDHNLNNAIFLTLKYLYGENYILDNYHGNDYETSKLLIMNNIPQDYLASLTKERINSFVSAFQAYNNKSLFFKLIDKKFAEKFFEVTNIDILIYLKGNVNNPDESVVDIITEENNFKDVYNLLKGIYKDDSAYGINRLNKIIAFYKKYPKLCEKLNENTILTDIQKKNLISLLNRNDSLKIENLYDLTIIDELIDKEINDVINSVEVEVTKMKDIFLINFVNLSYKELRNIFDNHMSVSTLEKILAKEMNVNDRKYIENLYCLFVFLNETINSVNDIDSLKNMSRLINTKEKRERTSEIYKTFSNIMEIIRRVYEIDANNTLTNLSNLPKSLFDKKNGYYDLSQSEYGLYAHATDLGSLEGLVNPKFQGYNHICLSPISDKMVKWFYNNNIIVLYDKIPEGAFIGSSISNIASNSRMSQNDFNVASLIQEYHQFEFKDSSRISEFGRRTSHSETNCWRDGMVPSGVLILGNAPSDKERQAAELLRKLTGKPIPLIKVQEIGKEIDNPKKIEMPKEVTKSQDQIEEYKELFKQLEEVKVAASEFIKKDEITEIENRRYATGASHDLFFCKINGEEYLLKPGMDRSLRLLETHRVYANDIGYRIQQLVNPETAIEIKKIEAPIFSNGSTVLCAATKLIPNVSDFEYLDEQVYPSNNYRPLNESQVSSLCKELMVDYLIFNLDAKGANFITDGNLVYGIDKEQALKHALSLDTNLNYAANASNAPQSMYNNVFEAYKSGHQAISSEVFEEMESIAERISAMNDEEYYEIFREYVECQNPESHEQLKNITLARKNALYSEILKFEEDLGVRKGSR